MKKNLICPSCGGNVPVYANPKPTTDIVIYCPGRGVVMIKRKNPPYGYALPGGFIDDGEWIENAARREAMEETGLELRLVGLLGVYSRPDRDPRHHTMTTTFVAVPADPDKLQAGDDAGEAFWGDPRNPPSPLAFDHGRMIKDFVEVLDGRRHLAGLSTEWISTEAGRASLSLAKLPSPLV